MPMIGRDWAQSGVTNLYTKIYDNGYKFVYLSARAIGQARTTREYLRSVVQGEIPLPDGPLLLSPTSLISAFHREVIEKKPEEFKISCLKDIQALFPTNPFCAGFGNKINVSLTSIPSLLNLTTCFVFIGPVMNFSFFSSNHLYIVISFHRTTYILLFLSIEQITNCSFSPSNHLYCCSFPQDTWAYRAVNIPLSRIFTVNHRGELKLELIQTFQSS